MMIDRINVCSMLPSDTVIPRSSCEIIYWKRYKITILMMMLAIPSVSILIGVARNFSIFLITQYISRNIAPSISSNGVADRARGSIVNPPWGMYKATITNTKVLMIIESTSHPSMIRTRRDRYKCQPQKCLLRKVTYRNILDSCKRKMCIIV